MSGFLNFYFLGFFRLKVGFGNEYYISGTPVYLELFTEVYFEIVLGFIHLRI